MPLIDWRELYASNRATIQRGVAATPELPGGRPRPGADWTQITIGGTVRRALVHVPPGLEPGAAVPLVCMLHGCTQDAATFAAATRMDAAAERHGFVVVYPQQERRDNQSACWNWFLREHQRRDGGEPRWVAAIVREVCAAAGPHVIDARRVFVAGLSAGAAMAVILAATHPDLFAAVAVHSGLAYGAATSLEAAFAAMARGAQRPVERAAAAHAAPGELARPVPSIVIHGSSDATVAPINGEQVLRQSMAANRLAAPGLCDVDFARPTARSRGQVDGGLAYTRERWADRRGVLLHEHLRVEGLGHAWSGGAHGGSFTDPRGPDATEAIWRFFREATARERVG